MRISSILSDAALGFMVLFASALITAPASTVRAQAFPSINCDAPGANLQTMIDHAADGATIFFDGNCDDGPYFINAGQNLHLRGFSSERGTLSAPGGGDCVVCVRFAHVKFTRLDIDATGANTGISVFGSTAEIFDTNINAGTFAGISVFGGTVHIANDTNINANGAFAAINIEGGETFIGPETDIDATGAQNGIVVNGGTVNIFRAVIHDSDLAGVGIHVRNSSSASISESSIIDGGGDGIVVISSSSADIAGNMITGNGGDGVSVTFHSSVGLGPNTIEDNVAFGVRCGVSGALVVFVVPDFGAGNGAGNTALDPACEVLNLSGELFP